VIATYDAQHLKRKFDVIAFIGLFRAALHDIEVGDTNRSTTAA